jgi:hypothetical protein
MLLAASGWMGVAEQRGSGERALPLRDVRRAVRPGCADHPDRLLPAGDGAAGHADPLARGQIASWEAMLALVLAVASISVLVRLAGRVDADALLRTGGKVRLRDAWRVAGATASRKR